MGAAGLVPLYMYDRWETLSGRQLWLSDLGHNVDQGCHGTVFFTAVEEGRTTGQEFSHQQSSQITRKICYKLIRTDRHTCSSWWEWNLCHSGSTRIIFGCNNGSYRYLELAQTSVSQLLFMKLFMQWAQGNLLACPSSTHSLGVIQCERLWPDTWRLQLSLHNCCRLVLPYQAVQHATDGTRKWGGGGVLLLTTIPAPHLQ